MSPKFTSNLGAIRLIAAYLVLLRHSFTILGEPNPLESVPFGIWIFFAISGYLLPSSWQRDPRPFPYAKARFRRLFPALAAVVLFSAFVIGPIFTTIPRREYLPHPETWNYLLNLLFHPMYFLPGVFAENPYPYAVNGSLWSLPPQVLTYLLVPLVFVLRYRGARLAVWALIFAFAQWNRATGLLDETVIWGSNVSQTLSAVALFAAGAFLRESKIRLHLGVAGILLALLVCAPLFIPGSRYPLISVIIPYVVVTVGLRSWPILRAANRLPDISYGVFLLGFPIQQSMIALAPELNPWLNVLIAAVVSTLGALVLERFVERPILQGAARREAGPRQTPAGRGPRG